MRKFVFKMLSYGLATLLLMVVFDILYTGISTSYFTRNKIQFLVNAPPRHYDVLILGSSRAENHLIPELFEQQGLTAYNMAMSGANLCENALQLKLFFERGNSAKVVLLQLDINYQSEFPAEGIRALAMPYEPLRPSIYQHYRDVVPYFAAEHYVPFYRYMFFDAKIGLREMALTAWKKPGSAMLEKGFAGLEGKMERKGPASNFASGPGMTNRYYNEIKQVCKAHHSQLISFEAPFCQYTGNRAYFDALARQHPEIYNYSNTVSADSLFSSCGHMNRQGAKIFTKIILEQHFKALKKPS